MNKPYRVRVQSGKHLLCTLQFKELEEAVAAIKAISKAEGMKGIMEC